MIPCSFPYCSCVWPVRQCPNAGTQRVSRPYREDQRGIAAWADATFGRATSIFRTAARAAEEMAELVRAVALLGDGQGAGGLAAEIADVRIVLYRVAELLGVDVDVRLSELAPVLGTESWRERVTQWAASSAFPAREPQEIVAVANYAMAKLLRELAMGADVRAATLFLLQTAGRLHWLAETAGYDLSMEVDKKMAINRARNWRTDHRVEPGGGLTGHSAPPQERAQ